MVFLTGLPGSGKTFLGQYAAERLKLHFYDLDQWIAEKLNRSIADIFTKQGETGFRELEAEMLRKLTRECLQPALIATGGGTVCYHHNLQWMRSQGILIWLDAPIELILQYLGETGTDRPLFAGKNREELQQTLNDLYLKRQPFYRQSHHTIRISKDTGPELFTKQLQLSTIAKIE